MANPWFRMYSEFATDPKVQMMSEADQRRFIMLLCMRCSNDNVTLQDDEVAFQLRISNEQWAESKAVLIAKNLIDDGNAPTAWDRRQFASDSSAERVAKHRAKKKQGCNVTETPPEADTESESDSDSDSDSEKPEVIHTLSESESLPRETPPEPVPAKHCTPAGEACRAIREAGIQTTNPSHPTLIALLNAGADANEFRIAAREAVAKGKADFAYVIGIVRKRREEAAALVLHQGRMPNKQEALEESNRTATAGWVPPELREKSA